MKFAHAIALVSAVILCVGCASSSGPGSSRPIATNLRCEYLTDPLGIDVDQPRLSWVLASRRRGQMQRAYQILVASSTETLRQDMGDLWDTGKVESDQSVHVPYAGKPLNSRTRCYWKVRVWSGRDKPSAWSRPGKWEMGLLTPDAWQAQWISAPAPSGDPLEPQPSPYFRKTLFAEERITSARMYITGLGYYELYINGKRIGDHVLDPAFTRYDRRVLYVTYDVTNQMRQGSNAIGVVLGNGWYNMHTHAVWNFDKAPWRGRPTLLCQLEIEYADGSVQTIISDGSWKVSTGPILFDSIRNGQTYDARLEMPGWNRADYNDSGWEQAAAAAGPAGELAAQMCQPIKVTQTITPVDINEPVSGVYVFDMGQNMAGWAKLKVSGPAGTKIVMKYGERLNPDGTVDQEEIGKHIKEGLPQTDTYILKGEGTETWEPDFTYHGFRYVEVTGLREKPTPETLVGRVVHTAFDRAGRFECSNDLLNDIQEATLWAYRGTFHGYPTDCPHREKNGWTGDAHLAAECGLYNFKSAPAYTKWMDDFKDEQRDSGELPGIVPTGGWGYSWGNGPAWDSAYLLIPWYLHEYRGDSRILAEHYDRFKRYVDYLTSKATDHIVGIGLGDWVPAKTKTPAEVTSTGYYYRDALIVSKVAEMLGKDEDMERYALLAADIAEAFHSKFYDARTGLYAGGTQTAMSCALYHNLVPDDQRQRVVDNLAANIESLGGHLDAGILGTKYLIDALTQNGRADVVYTFATKEDYPSWGNWLRQGATTLWEQWDGEASRNHIMFGHISAWFYQAIAGIKPDPDTPGFKRSIIHPRLLGDITHASAEHETMYGSIAVSWQWQDPVFTMDLTIPANTSATVHIPATTAKDVKESGKPANRVRHIVFLRTEEDYAVYAVGSGDYHFVSKPAW